MRFLCLLLAASALAVDPTTGKKVTFSDDFNGDALDESKWTLPANRETAILVKGGKDKVLRISLRKADDMIQWNAVTTQGKCESGRIAATFKRQGFEALDLTHDYLAKEHVRHMVGGPSALAQDERLLRFVFPERPGALMKFLSHMRPGWNISLFHYRNQGADYGRILVGLQVPKGEMKAFKEFLDTLGYPHIDETQNPVYRLFLRA